eukprot:sb/3478258/
MEVLLSRGSSLRSGEGFTARAGSSFRRFPLGEIFGSSRWSKAADAPLGVDRSSSDSTVSVRDGPACGGLGSTLSWAEYSGESGSVMALRTALAETLPRLLFG